MATVTEAGLWVDQVAAASAAVNTAATAPAQQAWSAFTDWYDAAAVAALAAELAALSQYGQEAVTGVFTEYVGQVAALVRDTSRIEIPNVTPRPIRNGVDPVVVHSRPAYAFKEAFALSGAQDKAIEAAVQRGIRLIEDDLMLAARQAQAGAMAELKIDRYRRVLRPELSDQGPCGLCVVASNRIYYRRQMLPIHGRCKCATMLINGDSDPGLALNRDDLDQLYEVAGSSRAADLKRIRVSVSEHGELGPVLHTRGTKIGLRDDEPPDPDRRQRRLAALQGVLAQLEAAAGTSRDRDARIAFQKSLIDATSA